MTCPRTQRESRAHQKEMNYSMEFMLICCAFLTNLRGSPAHELALQRSYRDLNAPSTV